MAQCQTAPANSSCFHPRAVASSPSSLTSASSSVSPSVGTKVFVGLKAQNRLGSSELSCPNVNARFYTSINRRVSLGAQSCIARKWKYSLWKDKILSYCDNLGGKILFYCDNFSSVPYDLTPCMALYDTMLSLNSPICAHCLGFAFNLTGFILVVGQKGSCTRMPLCRVSLQSAAGAARRQVDDIENESNELNRIKNYLYGKLAEHTGHFVEKVSIFC
ncbi:hypothetical protein ZWY2020_006391 [Hordeum vulgare]|nr:hypothetical protein ZWY2020_006391 [Hordeum vulgare]